MKFKGWIIGIKRIERFTGIQWQALQRWRKEFNMPIHYLPNGKPFIVASELKHWILRVSHILEKLPCEENDGS